MNVRLPRQNGVGNVRDMAAKIQNMQSEMEKATEELKNKIYTFEAGGKVVKAEINGNLELINLDIDWALMGEDAKDMLAETIIAAVNGAIKAAKDDKDMVMQNVSEGLNLPMNIPGLF